jgi:hypothetical protein
MADADDAGSSLLHSHSLSHQTEYQPCHNSTPEDSLNVNRPGTASISLLTPTFGRRSSNHHFYMMFMQLRLYEQDSITSHRIISSCDAHCFAPHQYLKTDY